MCCNRGDPATGHGTPHPMSWPTFSQQRHPKPTAFAKIFANTMQPSRLHRLGSRWTILSTKVGEVRLRFVSTVSCAISLVPFIHVPEIVPCMRNCISMTHARPSNIGCSEIQHLTRSSWSGCRQSSLGTTAGLRSSNMLWRCSRKIAAKTFQLNSQRIGNVIGAAGTFQPRMKSRLLSLAMGPNHMVTGTLLFTHRDHRDGPLRRISDHVPDVRVPPVSISLRPRGRWLSL